tara:strand:+ start:1742 stop:2041 length:300 start_codon:yes stop_codon:yes gene_type:complete
MALVQTDSKQFGLKDDMRITFTDVAYKLGVSVQVVHRAAKEGKLENVTFVGQGGWSEDTLYNNETTMRAVKKWRKGVRKYTRKPVAKAVITLSQPEKAA